MFDGGNRAKLKKNGKTLRSASTGSRHYDACHTINSAKTFNPSPSTVISLCITANYTQIMQTLIFYKDNSRKHHEFFNSICQ
jgi:hypothetical protein